MTAKLPPLKLSNLLGEKSLSEALLEPCDIAAAQGSQELYALNRLHQMETPS